MNYGAFVVLKTVNYLINSRKIKFEIFEFWYRRQEKIPSSGYL